MREAERLLSEYPDAKVKDVAFKCGFDETSPFSKAFKKWSGYGPLAFRKQKRIEESEDWVRLLEKYKWRRQICKNFTTINLLIVCRFAF